MGRLRPTRGTRARAAGALTSDAPPGKFPREPAGGVGFPVHGGPGGVGELVLEDAAGLYANVTLWGAPREAVLRALRARRRTAWVAPARHGMTTVFDRGAERQDAEELGALAASLSAELDCGALAVLNHADRVLALALYAAGELRTEYESTHPGGVRVAALCRAFGSLGLYPAVWALLFGPRPVLEVARHRALAWTLGLPPWSVGCGYWDVERGRMPPGLRRWDLCHSQRGPF